MTSMMLRAECVGDELLKRLASLWRLKSSLQPPGHLVLSNGATPDPVSFK
jgi:hypothetical protein